MKSCQYWRGADTRQSIKVRGIIKSARGRRIGLKMSTPLILLYYPMPFPVPYFSRHAIHYPPLPTIQTQKPSSGRPFHASSLSSSVDEPLQGDFLPRYHHSPPSKQTSSNLTVGHLKFERRKENRREASCVRPL